MLDAIILILIVSSATGFLISMTSWEKYQAIMGAIYAVAAFILTKI